MRDVVLGKDNPVVDEKYPPGMAGFSCSSGGCSIFGLVYYAEGCNNPTIVLCHGFPGFEKNYDLAQTLRRAGFNVVCFSYRGAWGSHGDFTIAGVADDVVSVVRHVVKGRMPYPERFDTGRLILAGHSMGSFAACRAGAELGYVKDVILLSLWNVGMDAKLSRTDQAVRERADMILTGASVLAGTSCAALWNEILRHEEDLDLLELAPKYKDRHLLLLGADDDEATPLALHQTPLAQALLQAGAQVAAKTLPGDHSFSARRQTMAALVLDWLAERGY